MTTALESLKRWVDTKPSNRATISSATSTGKWLATHAKSSGPPQDGGLTPPR